MEKWTVPYLISGAVYFSNYHIMPAGIDLTQIKSVNVAMRSCRQLQCAIKCEHYIKEKSVCTGYHVTQLENADMCQCTLLATGGSGLTVALDGEKYMYTGSHSTCNSLKCFFF